MNTNNTAKIQNSIEKSNSELKKVQNFSVPINPLERLNFPVSIVKGTTDAKIIEVMDFEKLLTLIKSEVPKDKILSDLLFNLSNTDKVAYTAEKEKLKAFIIGRFSYRSDLNCKMYVPLLCFDIDGLAHSDLDFFTGDCKNIPYIFAVFPSPSRKGLRILVWCNATYDSHEMYYKSIVQNLSERLNIPLKGKGNEGKANFDTSCKNVSRLWFIAAVEKESFYFNQCSDIYELPTPPPSAAVAIEKPIERPQLKTVYIAPSEGENILSIAEKIELAERKTNKSDVNGRNNTIFQLACTLFEFNVPESDILQHCMSYVQDDFKQAEITKTVTSAKEQTATKSRYSDLQLMKYKRNGERKESVKIPVLELKKEAANEPKNQDKNKSFEYDKTFELDKETPKILQMKAYLEKKYDFKYDIVGNEIEYKNKAAKSYEVINENDLFVELMAVGFKGVEQPLMALLNSSFIQRYDPFVEYFETLPPWNATKPDYINKLASYVKAKDRDWFDVQFKKMLVRSIAGAINAIPFNKHCFTLVSSQNDGKSTFLRSLCPPRLENYITDNIEVDNKDGRIALCQNFIINLDELSRLNKKDVNTIKSFMSQEKVKDRLPFGKKVTSFKRRANFVGSTNKSEFLLDETGNVRWLIFEIDGIEHDQGGINGYSKNVDIDNVWSQAYHLFKSGFEFRLTADELKKSELNNTSFRVTTQEMDLLQQYFTVADENNTSAIFLTATNVTEKLQNKTTLKLNAVHVGRALTALQFPVKQKYIKERQAQVKGYYVLEIEI